MRLRVVLEKRHGSGSTPCRQRIGLMLALAVWPLDLQDGVRPVAPRRGEHEGNLGAGEGIVNLQAPPVDASLDEIRKLLEPLASAFIGREMR